MVTAIPKDLMKSVGSLSGACLGVTSVPFDWSEGFSETWETIMPSAAGITLAEVKVALEDGSFPCPDSNPYEMTCEELKELLENGGLTPDVELEAGEELTAERTAEVGAELLAQVEREYDAGVEFLEEWRDAYREMTNESDRFAPMMSYYYPLPDYRGDSAEDQKVLDSHGGACVLVDVGGEVVLALAGGGMDLRIDICLSYMLLGYLPPLYYCDLPHFAGQGLDEKMKWVLDGCVESCRRVIRDAKWTAKKLKDYKKELGSKKKKSA